MQGMIAVIVVFSVRNTEKTSTGLENIRDQSFKTETISIKTKTKTKTLPLKTKTKTKTA